MRESEPRPPVTMKDLAQTLGLSRCAISLALRESPKIGKATRERVQAAAREMGYEPNPAAAALSHFKRSSTVKPVQAALAWLNAGPEPEKLRSYREFNCYWLGAAAAARKFGYRLEEFVVDGQMPLPRLEKVLRARGINGILLPPDPVASSLGSGDRSSVDMGDFHWEDFSVVRLGRHPAAPHTYFVTSAQAANAMLAFDKMREKGYERIAYVGPKHRTRMFGAGFLWAQQELPQRLRLPPFLFRGAAYVKNQPGFEAWLKKTKPDAIFTENAELPGMLEKAGCRVPEEIGLAATSTLDCPIDAGIYQNPEEIGRVAILMLISLINDNDRGAPEIPREILVRGNWVDGASLPGR